MEQLDIDNTVDIFHETRKIAYSSPAFRTEVRFYLFIYFIYLSIFLKDEYRNMYEWIKNWTEYDLQNQTNSKL